MTTPLIVPIVNYLPQLLTGLLSAGAALGGVLLTQHRIDKRERAAAAKKADEERLFISTELVFVLEKFVEECVQVALDEGAPHRDNEVYYAKIKQPELILEGVSGDWRTLPAPNMYRIRELPVLLNEANKYLDDFWLSGWEPPENTAFFQARQYQFARLGIKALILSIRLRRLTGLPPTRLNATQWSAQTVLWKVWRRERKQCAEASRWKRENLV